MFSSKGKKTVRISEVCVDVFTGSTPSKQSYKTSGHKILKVRDLTGSGINWNYIERGFVSEEFFNKSKAKIQNDDILFISSAHHPKYIGKKIDIVSMIPKKYENKVTCVAELLVIRINKKLIDPYLVLSFLKTDLGYRSIQACRRGQTAHIYPKDIRNIKIQISKKDISQQMKKLEELLRKKTELEEELNSMESDIKNKMN